uniref:Uncharacterized protein n=1 Tax=Arundo donax TaxID=35708 RepID=A0A0A9CAT7_ARUDO
MSASASSTPSFSYLGSPAATWKRGSLRHTSHRCSAAAR